MDMTRSAQAAAGYQINGRPMWDFMNPNTNIIPGGHEYFDRMLQLVAGARRTIHLQSYIFDDDFTGSRVAEALMTAARRYVNVYVLVDGYASQVMAQKLIDRLRQAGVHFRFFEPLLHSSYFYFGRRLHHKIFVADNQYALVGGLNIADRYNDMPGEPAWLDFAVSVQGEVAAELAEICWKTWCGVRHTINSKTFEKKQPGLRTALSPQAPVQVRRNDWVKHKKEISDTYCEILETAQSDVTIVCSYFLPGKLMRRHLRAATARGIKITLITAGISDVPLAKMAERWMYDWLLRNGIMLYEYQPCVLHAKLAICDDKWFTLGSYNINDISAYASVELNLDVYDPFLCRRLNGILAGITLYDCIAVTNASIRQQKNVLKRFGRFLAYRLIRLLFHTVTFYYRQKN